MILPEVGGLWDVCKTTGLRVFQLVYLESLAVMLVIATLMPLASVFVPAVAARQTRYIERGRIRPNPVRSHHSEHRARSALSHIVSKECFAFRLSPVSIAMSCGSVVLSARE
jgi:hypothetical protein